MRRSFCIAAIAAAVLSCTTTEDNTISVVPYPNEIIVNNGTFNAAGAAFHCSADLDEASRNIITAFENQLCMVSGCEKASTSNTFTFSLDTSLPEEAYTLAVTRKTVEVKASSLRGFNYAIQTIKQMLPVEIFGKAEAQDKEWTIQCSEINDQPRFGYRGMHLDVSRHFFDMDMVKKYLDVMEIHKLNTLHWHLTDDQGWRIEIKKYPKLTEVGSIRKETLIGHLNKGRKYDGIPY